MSVVKTCSDCYQTNEMICGLEPSLKVKDGIGQFPRGEEGRWGEQIRRDPGKLLFWLHFSDSQRRHLYSFRMLKYLDYKLLRSKLFSMFSLSTHLLFFHLHFTVMWHSLCCSNAIYLER